MSTDNKVDAIASAFEEFKKLNDKRIKEIETKGYESSESKAAVEKANAEIDRLSAEVKQAQAAIQRVNANGSGGEEKSDKEVKFRKEAFVKFARQGKEALSVEEVKALSTGSDADGGYMVTPEMSAEIIKKVYESSPMRQLASVASIASNQFEIIEDRGEFDANWASEVGSRAESNTSQFDKVIIPIHELFAKPKATQQMLDDAGFSVESWIAEKVSDKFGRVEATAFITGNGVGKPRGVMAYASGTTGFNDIQQVVSGSAATLTADGLINLSYALKAAYKANAAFMMQRASVAVVRLFKDSQNQYLWQPSLQMGAPDMLLGKPIYEADDIAALGANALSVAFGDFKAAYQIVDRIGIRTLRDPFSSKPYVEFYTTKRVGGGVKNFEAVKIQKCST